MGPRLGVEIVLPQRLSSAEKVSCMWEHIHDLPPSMAVLCQGPSNDNKQIYNEKFLAGVPMSGSACSGTGRFAGDVIPQRAGSRSEADWAAEFLATRRQRGFHDCQDHLKVALHDSH